MKVLLIEDSSTSLQLITQQLQSLGAAVLPASDGKTGLQRFDAERPDLVLLDLTLPDIEGLELARRIRASEVAGQWTPIIFLSAARGDADLERGIAAGGDDCLAKPISDIVLGSKLGAMQRLTNMRNTLAQHTRALDEANRELLRLSAVDGLTGIANRRQLDQVLSSEWRRATRSQTPLSLLLLDVDCFKYFNNRYGHLASDGCLRQVAGVLSAQSRRSTDTVARYGGDQFVAILPETAADGAAQVADDLRAAVESLGIAHAASSAAGVVTVSIGASTLVPLLGQQPGALIAGAEKALHQAKRAGRNRVDTAVMVAPLSLDLSRGVA